MSDSSDSDHSDSESESHLSDPGKLDCISKYDENAFDMKTLTCLMLCPCTVCCGLAYMNSAMKNPPDAEKLSEDEAKYYVDQLQGLWDVIPMEQPDSMLQSTIAFSRVFVSGDKITFSGGPNGRTDVQTIDIHRTPEGMIFLDDKGSILTNFDPHNGVIEVKNVFGFKIMWKREGISAITKQLGTLDPVKQQQHSSEIELF